MYLSPVIIDNVKVLSYIVKLIRIEKYFIPQKLKKRYNNVN